MNFTVNINKGMDFTVNCRYIQVLKEDTSHQEMLRAWTTYAESRDQLIDFLEGWGYPTFSPELNEDISFSFFTSKDVPESIINTARKLFPDLIIKYEKDKN